MKFFVFTKQKLFVMLGAVLVCAIGVEIFGSSYSQVTTASTTERKIPIYCVEEDEKKVSISFDAAWGNEQTETLLDILDEKKVKSTFFLVGAWVDKYPESVKEIAKRGHDVGNHSDTHAHLPQLTDEGIKKELVDCNNKIEKLIGKCPTLFRPPYGDYNNNVVSVTNSINMYCVQWDIDSLDWKDPTPQQMVERIKNNLKNGSIILMHNGAKNTPEALPMIIDTIKEEGYTIVPISQLIPKGEYYTDHEGRMHLTETASENTEAKKSDSGSAKASEKSTTATNSAG